MIWPRAGAIICPHSCKIWNAAALSQFADSLHIPGNVGTPNSGYRKAYGHRQGIKILKTTSWNEASSCSQADNVLLSIGGCRINQVTTGSFLIETHC